MFTSIKINMGIGNYFAWSWARSACGMRDVTPPYSTGESLDLFYAASEAGIVFF